MVRSAGSNTVTEPNFPVKKVFSIRQALLLTALFQKDSVRKSFCLQESVRTFTPIIFSHRVIITFKECRPPESQANLPKVLNTRSDRGAGY